MDSRIVLRLAIDRRAVGAISSLFDDGTPEVMAPAKAGRGAPDQSPQASRAPRKPTVRVKPTAAQAHQAEHMARPTAASNLFDFDFPPVAKPSEPAGSASSAPAAPPKPAAVPRPVAAPGPKPAAKKPAAAAPTGSNLFDFDFEQVQHPAAPWKPAPVESSAPSNPEFEQAHPRAAQGGTINPETGKTIKPGQFAPKEKNDAGEPDAGGARGTAGGGEDALGGGLFGLPDAERPRAGGEAGGRGDAVAVRGNEGPAGVGSDGERDAVGNGRAAGAEPRLEGVPSDGAGQPVAERAEPATAPEVDAHGVAALSPDPGAVEQLLSVNRSPMKVGTDYHLTEADMIGAGGVVGKFNNNIAAIRTLREIEERGTPATVEEQAILAKYTGWGWAAPILHTSNLDRWNRELGGRPSWMIKGNEHYDRYVQLRNLLTPAEFEAAVDTINNAHYTSPTVVGAMWDVVQHLGFKGGRVLEPGCGIGNFAGFMPRDLWAASTFTGVEIDGLTARMAAQLYQSANVVNAPYQRTALPNGFFDLAIGNVPFQNNVNVADPEFDGRPGGKVVARHLHNFFFAKSLDKLREDGVALMISTSGSLDAPTSDAARRILSEGAEFLGAIRLPDNAFQANAGTSVVTDILAFRKRRAGELPRTDEAKWIDTVDVQTSTGPVKVNEYFATHPEMVLGDMQYTDHAGTKQGAGVTVVADGRDLGQAIRDAAAKFLPAGAMGDAPESNLGASLAPMPTLRQPGSLFVGDDGKLYQQGSKGPIPYTGKGLKRATAFQPMKAPARDLMKMMADPNASDADVEAAQMGMTAKLRAFWATHGPLHHKDNVQALRSDPDFWLLSAMEKFDRETGAFEPSAMLSQRYLNPRQELGKVSSHEDAMVRVLSDTGRLDFEKIASHMNGDVSADEVAQHLEASGHIFHNPLFRADDPAGYETKINYLSGDVRQKLEEARAAAQHEPRYEANVKALEAAQPEDMKPWDIEITCGAPWVGDDLMTDFANHLLQIPEYQRERHGVVLHFNPNTAEWQVHFNATSNYYREARNRLELGATDRIRGNHLLERVLNLKPATIQRSTADGKSYVDEAASAKARQVMDTIHEEFQKWLYSDPVRMEELASRYNRKFNNMRLAEYDGQHLELPGLSTAARAKMNPHVKDAIWRGVTSPNYLAAHCVGAGKSWIMSGIAAELRRRGIAKKPAVVVPLSTLGQFAETFQSLYPNAKVLVLSPSDMGDQDKRQEFLGRVAGGDWDAVIMSDTQLASIPMSAEHEERHYKKYLDDLQRAHDDASEQRAIAMANRDTTSKNKADETMKQLVAAKKRWQERLEAARQRRAKRQTGALTFDQLGIDHMIVDEFHLYKNLPIATALRGAKGLPGGGKGSDRAFDLHMKTQYIQGMRNGGGLTAATATPIANSLAEMFVCQKFLDPKGLKRQGLDVFDAWVRHHAKVTSDLEYTPTGSIKTVQRFSSFSNVGPLSRDFRSFADVKTRADLPDLVVPDVDNIPVLCEESEHQAAVTASLKARAEALKGVKPEAGEDNILAVYSDARANSLDARLVHPGAEHNPTGKIARLVENLQQELARDTDSAHMVFMDLGTPKGQGRQAKSGDSPEDASDWKDDVLNWSKDLPAREKEYVAARVAWLDGGSVGDEPTFGAHGIGADRGEEIDQYIDDNSEAETATETQKRVVLYDDVKRRLVDSGIPEHQIAFIQDWKTPEKKVLLAEKVKAGQVRVLIGSTATMGVGLNVQDKLATIHHMDPPFRPCDVEQRNGRIVRQGNTFDRVRCYTYLGVAKGSPFEVGPDNTVRVKEGVDATKVPPTMDAVLWQILERKNLALQQILTGRADGRSVEAMDADAFGDLAAAFTAATGGSPLFKEKVELEKDIRKLELQRDMHETTRRQAQMELAGLPGALEAQEKLAQHWETMHGHVERATGGDPSKFYAEIGGRPYTKRDEAGQAIQAELASFASLNQTGFRHMGTVNGLVVHAGKLVSMGDAFLTLSAPERGPEFESVRDHYGERLYAVKQHSIRINPSDSAAGLMQQVRNESTSFQRRAEKAREIAAARASQKESLERVAVPFPHGEALASKRARLAEVEKILDDDQKEKDKKIAEQEDPSITAAAQDRREMSEQVGGGGFAAPHVVDSSLSTVIPAEGMPGHAEANVLHLEAVHKSVTKTLQGSSTGFSGSIGDRQFVTSRDMGETLLGKINEILDRREGMKESGRKPRQVGTVCGCPLVLVPAPTSVGIRILSPAFDGESPERLASAPSVRVESARTGLDLAANLFDALHNGVSKTKAAYEKLVASPAHAAMAQKNWDQQAVVAEQDNLGKLGRAADSGNFGNTGGSQNSQNSQNLPTVVRPAPPAPAASDASSLSIDAPPHTPGTARTDEHWKWNSAHMAQMGLAARAATPDFNVRANFQGSAGGDPCKDLDQFGRKIRALMKEKRQDGARGKFISGDVHGIPFVIDTSSNYGVALYFVPPAFKNATRKQLDDSPQERLSLNTVTGPAIAEEVARVWRTFMPQHARNADMQELAEKRRQEREAAEAAPVEPVAPPVEPAAPPAAGGAAEGRLSTTPPAGDWAREQWVGGHVSDAARTIQQKIRQEPGGFSAELGPGYSTTSRDEAEKIMLGRVKLLHANQRSGASHIGDVNGCPLFVTTTTKDNPPFVFMLPPAFKDASDELRSHAPKIRIDQMRVQQGQLMNAVVERQRALVAEHREADMPETEGEFDPAPVRGVNDADHSVWRHYHLKEMHELAKKNKAAGDAPLFKIGDHVIDDQDEMGQRVIQARTALENSRARGPHKLGEIYGLPIYAMLKPDTTDASLVIVPPQYDSPQKVESIAHNGPVVPVTFAATPARQANFLRIAAGVKLEDHVLHAQDAVERDGLTVRKAVGLYNGKWVGSGDASGADSGIHGVVNRMRHAALQRQVAGTGKYGALRPVGQYARHGVLSYQGSSPVGREAGEAIHNHRFTTRGSAAEHAAGLAAHLERSGHKPYQLDQHADGHWRVGYMVGNERHTVHLVGTGQPMAPRVRIHVPKTPASPEPEKAAGPTYNFGPAAEGAKGYTRPVSEPAGSPEPAAPRRVSVPHVNFKISMPKRPKKVEAEPERREFDPQGNAVHRAIGGLDMEFGGTVEHQSGGHEHFVLHTYPKAQLMKLRATLADRHGFQASDISERRIHHNGTYKNEYSFKAVDPAGRQHIVRSVRDY